MMSKTLWKQLAELPILQDNLSKRRKNKFKVRDEKDPDLKVAAKEHIKETEKEIGTSTISQDTLRIRDCSITFTDLITYEYF